MAYRPIRIRGGFPTLQVLAFGEPDAAPVRRVAQSDRTQPHDTGGHPQRPGRSGPAGVDRTSEEAVHADTRAEPSAPLGKEGDIDVLPGWDLRRLGRHDHQTVGLGQRSQQM